MSEEQIDVAYRLLDLDLIDCEGRRCGKVDDLELDGEPGGTTHIAAIVSGPGALPRRLPRRLRRLGARVFGGRRVRVAWSEVAELEPAAIVLSKTAQELDLALGDRRLEWIFARGGDD